MEENMAIVEREPAIIEGQLDGINGALLYPDAIEVSSVEVANVVGFIDYAPTDEARENVLQVAHRLGEPSLPALFRPIEMRCLDESLELIKSDIENSDVLVLDFRRTLTTHSSAYNTLLSAFATDSDHVEFHTVRVDRAKIRSVRVLRGELSHSEFNPRLLLRVITGQEPALSSIKDGRVVDEQGPPRWFDFNLTECKLQTIQKIIRK